MSELVIEESDAATTISVRNGDDRVELPALWLRERTTAPDAVDACTGQRLYDPHLLPEELSVTRAAIDVDELRVLFSDGYEAVFEQDGLLADLTMNDGLPGRLLWRSDLGRPPSHDWNRLGSPADELAALTDFIRLGVIVIDNVATTPGAVMQVAAKFGFVRDTNFGAMFDVRTVPDSNDLAYRSVSLGPHTDNPYRTPVPGIQLLHCLVNQTTGGESSLVDGLAAVAQLQRDDPAAVELLATVPLRFRFRDETTEMVTIRPIVERDHLGAVTGLNYSPKLDAMPLMPAGEMQRFQAARRRLARLLRSPDFEIRFTLAAGEVMMFDNNRVLHGRSAFDPREGLRHLQGCYIDRDGPQARLRMLARRACASGVSAR